jgi:hypothetical protein
MSDEKPTYDSAVQWYKTVAVAEDPEEPIQSHSYRSRTEEAWELFRGNDHLATVRDDGRVTIEGEIISP